MVFFKLPDVELWNSSWLESKCRLIAILLIFGISIDSGYGTIEQRVLFGCILIRQWLEQLTQNQSIFVHKLFTTLHQVKEGRIIIDRLIRNISTTCEQMLYRFGRRIQFSTWTTVESALLCRYAHLHLMFVNLFPNWNIICTFLFFDRSFQTHNIPDFHHLFVKEF